MTNIITLEATITRMKAEVLRDIAIGVVPNDASSFAELHDYVDANYYGGFCEDEVADALIAQFGGRDADEGMPQGMPQGMVDFMNAAQDAVHEWLQLGDHIVTECEALVWLQTQAPAGNWTEYMGTSSLTDALINMECLVKQGRAARIEHKTITVLAV